MKDLMQWHKQGAPLQESAKRSKGKEVTEKKPTEIEPQKNHAEFKKELSETEQELLHRLWPRIEELARNTLGTEWAPVSQSIESAARGGMRIAKVSTLDMSVSDDFLYAIDRRLEVVRAETRGLSKKVIRAHTDNNGKRLVLMLTPPEHAS